MSSTYTKRLGLGTANSGFAQLVVATGASATTTVIRDVILANEHTAAQIIQLYVRAPGGNATIYHNTAAPAATTFHIDLRQVLEAGDDLVLISQFGAVNVIVTGYQLSP